MRKLTEEYCNCGKKATYYLGWGIYFCNDCDEAFGKQISSPIPTILIITGLIVFFWVI